MGKGESLGEFEQVVLLALIQLRGDAYGVTIRREIVERTGTVSNELVRVLLAVRGCESDV